MQKNRFARWSGLATAIVLACAAFRPIAPTDSASDPGLREVLRATAPFHDVATAEAAGYGAFLSCFDAPDVGGMGQHYVNLGLLDATLDAAAPEALVYEVRDDGLKLVGVEYLVPQAAWTGTEPPSLFGQDFHRNDTLGIWALHAWIWRPNPDGTFADFNPSVRMCP